MIVFLIDLWFHLGAKIVSKTAQDGPKTRPRRPVGPNLPPKPSPRRPKTAPRRAQDGHLAPTCRPSPPQDGPKTAQDGPNRPQVDHGTPQDASKAAQDENSRDLAKNKAKNKDITHDSKRTPDFKAHCCQNSGRLQTARSPNTWGGVAPPPQGALQLLSLIHI